MSQHKLTLDNSLGIHFRSNLNKIISALASNNSGSTSPKDTVPFMTWINSSNNEINIRDSTNTSWVKCGKVESGFGVYNGSWEYISSHDLSLTGWPSANTSSVSIDISSLENTDQIGFTTEYSGTLTANNKTLNLYSKSTIIERFNVNYLKNTTAYKENIITIIDEFRSDAPLGTPSYNSNLDFNLTNANSDARGITFANNKFWVVDEPDNKVYAYSTSGTYDSNASFNLTSSNTHSRGITFANNKFWATDFFDNKVYAYSTSGTYDSSASFNLTSDNGSAYGIIFANNKFWVVDSIDDKVYAYSASGTYDSNASFNLTSGNNSPQGITFANNKLWIVDDNDNKVYAYSSSGTYDASASFNLNSNNNHALGITFANNKFWVADGTDRKVYVYEIGGLLRSINVKIDTRSSTDTANTINAYLEANPTLSSHSLTTAKVHMYKWSLATS